MRTLGLRRTAERETDAIARGAADEADRLRRRHQRGDRERAGAADRVPAPAPRARALVGRGPARLGQAAGVRALDQLGDGALPRASWSATPAPSGPRGWSRSTRAPTRSSSRRAGPTRATAIDLAAQIARVREPIGLHDATPAARTTGSCRASARSPARPLLACDPHLSTTIPGLWYEADLVLRRVPRAGRHPPAQPRPGLRADAHCRLGLHERDGRHPGPVRRAVQPRRRRAATSSRATGASRGGARGDQGQGPPQPEVLDVTITHHGPIVNEALGADRRAAPGAVLDGASVPAALRRLASGVARARSGEELVAATAEHTVAAAQHALGRQRRKHRLQAGRQAAGAPRRLRPTCRKPGWTGEFEWDGTVPYEELPERRQPGQRLPRHGQQPHRRRRLPAPHHLRVDDRLPRPADRGDARRARAALARGLRAHAARRLVAPGHRDGPPAVAAAPERRSARRGRSSGSRAGTASSTPRPSPARSTTPSRSSSRARWSTPRDPDAAAASSAT